MGCGPSQAPVADDEPLEQKSSGNQGNQGIEQYAFRRTLGKGASCRVVEAINKSDPSEKLAIKIMSKDKAITKTLYNHEVKILTKLQHKNIIKLINNMQDDSNYYVLTGLCEGGELFDRIVNPNFNITEKTAAHLIRDMLLSLQYCHQKNIVHRDLKPENFVFETEEEDANIVLIDFGCAKEVNEETEYKELVGTVYYLAPELAAQTSKVPKTGKVLKAADVWSMGVIAFVMMTGRPPFKGRTNKEIFTNVIRDTLQFPDDIELSDGFKDFVKQALIKNPHKRISLEDAIRHPWVQGKDAKEIAINKEVVRYLRQFNYQSKLKKAITQCLARNMSEEPEKEVRRHFARLDKDGDEKLDEDELKLLLLDMGFAPSKAKGESMKIMEQADTNKNGTIEFDEFKAIWHRKLLSQHDQYIHRVFAVFDDNGDGEIDANELQEVLGEDFGKIVEMIQEVDIDKNGKISFEEFQKAMQEDMSGGMNMSQIQPGAGTVNESDRPDIEVDY